MNFQRAALRVPSDALDNGNHDTVPRGGDYGLTGGVGATFHRKGAARSQAGGIPHLAPGLGKFMEVTT